MNKTEAKQKALPIQNLNLFIRHFPVSGIFPAISSIFKDGFEFIHIFFYFIILPHVFTDISLLFMRHVF